MLLIEGLFGTNPKMTVENEKNHVPGKGLQRREAERLHVTLSENDASVVTVHYAPPKKVKNPRIYVLSGNEWRRVQTHEDGSYIGRTRYDAPEIDNAVIFTGKQEHKPGDMVMVHIDDAFDDDLAGTEV